MVENNEKELFKLAYILTIYKAQGSEAKNVVLLLIHTNYINNQLLYTGITRAKEHCTIICKKEIYKYAITHTEPIRYSNIAHMIDNYPIN